MQEHPATTPAELLCCVQCEREVQLQDLHRLIERTGVKMDEIAALKQDRKFTQAKQTLLDFMASSVAKNERGASAGGGGKGNSKKKKKMSMMASMRHRAASSKTSSVVFSSGHNLHNKMQMSLMNLCTKCGDLVGAIKACGQVLDSFEQVCPANWPETANHHAWRVELIEALFDSVDDGSEKHLPPKMKTHMKTLLLASSEKCLTIREVCFGKSHPLTLRARAKVLVNK